MTSLITKDGGEEVKHKEIQEPEEQQRSLFKPVSKTVSTELSASNTVSSDDDTVIVSNTVHTVSNDDVSSDVSKEDETINHIYELFIGVCTTLNKVIENIEDYRDKAKDTRNWVEFLRFYELFKTIPI